MRWIDRLDTKFGRYGVPNITVLLIAGQVIAYLVSRAPQAEGLETLIERMWLVPGEVLSGEWWRVFTYLFVPPGMNPIFAFFYWYMFYLMGSTLEAQWGAFRYNLYLLLGYVASVGMAFVAYFATGGAVGMLGPAAPNEFLYGTVFLAFARLYPDFVLSIFFVLPVKVRWLATFTWIIYGMNFLFSREWLTQAMIVAAVFNYLVFFGREIVRDMRHRHRRMQFQSRALAGKGKNGSRGRGLIHTCHVCGLSSTDSPRTAFRYCMACGGDLCYCPDHINSHEHVRAAAPAADNDAAK